VSRRGRLTYRTRNGPINTTTSKSGTGWSIRVAPGVRVGRGATGMWRLSVYLPGTGLGWTKELGK
jgi:hypothetical protein